MFNTTIPTERQLAVQTFVLIYKKTVHIAGNVTGRGPVLKRRKWKGFRTQDLVAHHVTKLSAKSAGRRDMTCTRNWLQRDKIHIHND